MITMIALLAFGAVAMGAWAALRPRENVVARRMAAYTASPASEMRLEGSVFRRVLGPMATRIGHFLARLLPQNMVREVDRLLMVANSRMSVLEYLALWLASVLFGFLILFRVIQTPTMGFGQVLVVGILLFGGFGLGPYLLLRRRAAKRKKAIRRALPDALDLLVTGVEAGLGVDAAVAMVAERTRGPLSECLHLYMKQVGLGRPRREALADVAERSGVDDFIRFAAAVVQAEQMGTNLGDVLRQQAEDARVLRWQRAQEAAQRAPVWMTIPLALFFLPAMVAVVIVPSVMNMMTYVSTLGAR